MGFSYCRRVWQKLSFSWQYHLNTWWPLTGVTCNVRKESSGVCKLKKLEVLHCCLMQLIHISTAKQEFQNIETSAKLRAGGVLWTKNLTTLSITAGLWALALLMASYCNWGLRCMCQPTSQPVRRTQSGRNWGIYWAVPGEAQPIPLS